MYSIFTVTEARSPLIWVGRDRTGGKIMGDRHKAHFAKTSLPHGLTAKLSDGSSPVRCNALLDSFM
ncbi:MAG: hypothetical protein GDA56_32265 [Hormoscilla sp. GM7CHS1pb]|nr:hypothetical protein [Hormoscilla sp. GM7CHS1pb]